MISVQILVQILQSQLGVETELLMLDRSAIQLFHLFALHYVRSINLGVVMELWEVVNNVMMEIIRMVMDVLLIVFYKEISFALMEFVQNVEIM